MKAKCLDCDRIEEWLDEPNLVSITYVCEECAKRMKTGYVNILSDKHKDNVRDK